MLYTSGKDLLTREELRKIPIPQREEAKTWVGINHGELADAIVDEIKLLGFGISQELWFCNTSQSAMYGSVDVVSNGTEFELEIGQDASFSLGVRHDNNSRYAVSIAVGARVAVCQNGLFAGDFVLKKRHSERISLQDIVNQGIEEWLSSVKDVENFANGMRLVDLGDKEVSYLLMLSSETMPDNEFGCINWAYLQKVLSLWKKPTYEEFSDRTMWSLYNCYTEVAKELSPPRQLRLLKGLKELFTHYVMKLQFA